jgi:hypothetical protein
VIETLEPEWLMLTVGLATTPLTARKTCTEFP